MKNNKNIWIASEDLVNKGSLEELSSKELYNNPLLQDLAAENSEISAAASSNRRDFLKYLGFGLGAATIAASCDTPIRKALPYVTKPDAIVPGVATYYASSFVKGGDFVPVLVKTREGRPIKIEGNSLCPMTKGGTSARAQASVLDLYNISRLKEAGKINAEKNRVDPMSWEDLDKEIIAHLSQARSIRVLRNTDMGLSHSIALQKLGEKFSNVEVVTYDAFSSSALLDANKESFGKRVIPSFRFDKADIIVSFGADFLGTWISPVEYARQFADRRRITQLETVNMNRLYMVESTMSLTGSNADHRVTVKPSEQGLAIALLHNLLASSLGLEKVNVNGTLSHPKAMNYLNEMAEDLLEAKGKSLIVSSSNNFTEQLIINRMNLALGNYENTLDLNKSSFQRGGCDKSVLALLGEMSKGAVDVLIVMDGANPVYDLPEGDAFAQAMEKVNCKISLSCLPSETWALCDYAVPSTHWLESWNDFKVREDFFAIGQPTIRPLFNTRSTLASLLVWLGEGEFEDSSEAKSDEVDQRLMIDYNFIYSVWEKEVFPIQGRYNTLRSFWENTLHDGFVVTNVGEKVDLPSGIVLKGEIGKVSEDEEIVFYESVAIGSGHYADNPWLQEMPDPLTRVVWDNYVHLPIQWDGNDFKYYNDIKEDGVLVDVSSEMGSVRLPVVRQFGQMSNTFAVALGYGRQIAGAAAKEVGAKVTQFLQRNQEGYLQYFGSGISISAPQGKDPLFACVQLHHTMGLRGEDLTDGGKVINVDEKKLMTIGTGFQGALTERSVIFEGDINSLEEDVDHLLGKRKEFAKLNSHSTYAGFDDLYQQGHHWGLAVDMNACIGCGACQVACIAENNVPIVGKEEVHRVHEMTWMRIDRYYYGEVDNPNVVYQPMMCQHCDNAPCENVCPVAATTHSAEGLNQMTYNRCVGTRYCANNCPYKVRRFNWLDYTTADLFPINEVETFNTGTDAPFYAHDLTRMVLNPDVTVRSRGVIEKCSFCVQRIQEGKLKAKKEGRRLIDGEIKSACQTSCPTGAIVFGDMNDENSEVSKIKKRKTSYVALEETNVRSSVDYQMRITNKKAALKGLDA
jgi:Fe-S-cluster-containing dehydrogenase component